MPKPSDLPAFLKYQSFRVEPGLYIVEPKGGRTYQARCRVDGQWHYTGTETADFQAAKQFAMRWVRQLRAGRAGYETVQQAADAYFDSIREPGKRAYHKATFAATREFWTPGMGRPSVVVADIDTPKLLEFTRWRQVQSPNGRSQNARITSNTMHKDLVTLRQILKFAVARGVISNVPLFPGVHIIGTIEKNVQPWLMPDEWKRLIAAANERINEAANIRTREQRTELRDFLLWMHATGLRVDEAAHMQVRDCTIKHAKAPWTSIDARTLPMYHQTRGVRGEQIAYRRKSKTEGLMQVRKPYVELRLRVSKTGPRVCQSRAYADAIFRRLAKDKAPTDLLFREHHRDAFRELLIAADLRENDYGVPRNSKCLRPTAISHWLLDYEGKIPLQWLAANCGTSIVMLQDHYLKRLGLAMDGSAWL